MASECQRTDASILCHPNIPKPLHGVNPRTIYGKDWWDKQRQIAYASTDYHCLACGVHKSRAKFHRWLEAHEFYLFDYKRGRITFDHLVPLCHACHNYIHDGRMQMMVDRDDMSEEKYSAILEHGDTVIKQAGLMGKRNQRHKLTSGVVWSQWRMVVDGKEYGPSTQTLQEWMMGMWRDWKP